MNNFLYILALVLVVWSQFKVNGAYAKYRNVATRRGYRGFEVARMILNQNGLHDVKIEMATGGELSDHYDPQTNTVRLSKDVYYNDSVASVAISAHEVGHAIQHATNYAPVKIRTAIVPITNIGSKLAMPLILLGIFLGSVSYVFIYAAVLGLGCGV